MTDTSTNGLRNEKGQFIKGHSSSKEIRMSMSQAHKYRVYKPHTEETKRKISQSERGKIISVATRKKMSIAKRQMTDETKKKLSIVGKGRIISLETRKKISNALRREKHPAWRGGISLDIYPLYWTETLKKSIRQRDNYTCQKCEIHEDEFNGRTKKMDVHHIDYDKENCNPCNLITLCKSCHAKTNVNRDYWLSYFAHG